MLVITKCQPDGYTAHGKTILSLLMVKDAANVYHYVPIVNFDRHLNTQSGVCGRQRCERWLQPFYCDGGTLKDHRYQGK